MIWATYIIKMIKKIMYHFSLSSSIGAGSLDIINSTYICMIEFTLESNITAINNNNQAKWKGCCFNHLLTLIGWTVDLGGNPCNRHNTIKVSEIISKLNKIVQLQLRNKKSTSAISIAETPRAQTSTWIKKKNNFSQRSPLQKEKRKEKDSFNDYRK